VIPNIADEEVLGIEADERQAAQAGTLGEEFADIVRVDLDSSLERKVRDAKPFQPCGLAWPGVPANVMAGGLEVHRDTGERVEVTIGRIGGEEDFHGSDSRSMSRRRGNQAKLLQQAHGIGLDPVFNNFPIRNPVDVNKRPLRALASGWNTQERPGVSPLDTRPENDFITLGNRVQNGRLRVGETCKQHAEERADSLNSRWHSWIRGMLNMVRAKQGESILQVFGIDPVGNRVNEGLVFFD